MKTLEATPTEYKGIRFRSKSEAIFARALDLTPDLLWEYEPVETESGWKPDFRVDDYFGPDHTVLSSLVEYKPSRPTDTYMRNKNAEAEKAGFCRPYFCFGSPWCKKWGGIFFTPWDEVSEHTWSPNLAASFLRPFNYLEEASNYRFDLKEER